jgi:hypothetical protein
MKPTEFADSNSPLTAVGIIKDMLKFGIRRACLVRPAQAGRTPGVAVFMLDPASVRAVGPYLRTVFETIQQPPNCRIMADQDSHLPTVMQAMEEAGQQFTWLPLQFEAPPGKPAIPDGLLAIIVGAHVNETFAAELTARGCLCNLT